MSELKYWKHLSETWDDIKKRLTDLNELAPLVNFDDETEMKGFSNDFKELESHYNKAHVGLFLNGPFDKGDALLVISSGTGGVEAMDWAEMLMRMYLRFAEKKDFKVNVLDKSDGQEAGIKSVTLEMKGMMAFGTLKSEHGVHRLVRLSPFNAKSLRQTSFALVEVLPVLHEAEGVTIEEKDLRVDTFRSGGAGGQSVNKTESAIRLTHMPTGLVVACQTERSQIQNRARAMQILKAKIMQRLHEEHKERVEELKGGYKEAAWGNQIRSYVFQPYTMVKDHRTDAETSQVHDVMDGDLDLFIEAYLIQSAQDKAK